MTNKEYQDVCESFELALIAAKLPESLVTEILDTARDAVNNNMQEDEEQIGPCNFSFPDVKMNAEQMELELTETEQSEVWDEVRGDLKHCDSISFGNDLISDEIARKFSDRLKPEYTEWRKEQ